MYRIFLEKSKQFFYTGLLFLLPLALSIGILRFLLDLLSRWLSPIARYVPQPMKAVPHPEIFLALAIIFLCGYIIQTFVLGSLIEWGQALIIKRIPLVKQIYFAIKRVLLSVNKRNNAAQASQQVAWVRLPYRGIYCLGFMTDTLPKSLSPDPAKTFYSFFIPTTPNPVSGYYVAVAQEDCVFIGISREEAVSMIISGGMVNPEAEKNATSLNTPEKL